MQIIFVDHFSSLNHYWLCCCCKQREKNKKKESNKQKTSKQRGIRQTLSNQTDWMQRFHMSGCCHHFCIICFKCSTVTVCHRAPQHLLWWWGWGWWWWGWWHLRVLLLTANQISNSQKPELHEDVACLSSGDACFSFNLHFTFKNLWKRNTWLDFSDL